MASSSAARVIAPTQPQPELTDVFELVRDDFDRVDRLIPRQLSSGIPLVEEIGRYIVSAGGKRLRPLIVLLAARACGFCGTGSNHIRLATVIEFLHTATLLHDDVVDKSARRRGRPTANVLWGNAPSVLVGDFLYSRGFQLMVEIESMDVMAIVSDATNLIAEGESDATGQHRQGRNDRSRLPRSRTPQERHALPSRRPYRRRTRHRR